MLDKGTLERIFAVEKAVPHIVADAVRRRDFELLDAAFEMVPLEVIASSPKDGYFPSSDPSGPLVDAIKNDDLEMLSYLQSKGLGAVIHGRVSVTTKGRELATYDSPLMKCRAHTPVSRRRVSEAASAVLMSARLGFGCNFARSRGPQLPR